MRLCYFLFSKWNRWNAEIEVHSETLTMWRRGWRRRRERNGVRERNTRAKWSEREKHQSKTGRGKTDSVQIIRFLWHLQWPAKWASRRSHVFHLFLFGSEGEWCWGYHLEKHEVLSRPGEGGEEERERASQQESNLSHGATPGSASLHSGAGGRLPLLLLLLLLLCSQAELCLSSLNVLELLPAFGLCRPRGDTPTLIMSSTEAERGKTHTRMNTNSTLWSPYHHLHLCTIDSIYIYIYRYHRYTVPLEQSWTNQIEPMGQDSTGCW